jgi:hypothetical protein
VVLSGLVTAIEPTAAKQLEVSAGTTGRRKWLAVDENCRLSLNGATTLAGQPVGLADLRAGDHVQLEYDARVTKITASRVYTVTGEVPDWPEAASFAVKLAGVSAPVRFTLAPSCQVELAEKGPVDLSYLRPGDKVKVTHDSPDLKNPQASAVTIEEAYVNQDCWAAIIVEQQYDDKSLPEIAHAAADGKLLREAIGGRYRVPEKQLLYSENASRLKVEQELEDFLRDIPPDSQVVVYFLGHGQLVAGSGGLLATREFEVAKAAATGFPLKWLVGKLEDCRAEEKILLLDTCQADESPSSEELILSLRAPGGTKVSKSVTLVGSCSKGQSGAVVERDGEALSAFAAATADAFGGKADVDRNLRVDAGELYNFVHSQLVALSGSGRASPVRFLPDRKEERITEGGKEGVRKVLRHLPQKNSDPRILTDDFLAAEVMCPKQPEPRLALGLVLLKQNKGTEAAKQFELVGVEHPKEPLAYQGLAWHHFNQGKSEAGLADLVQLLGALPRPAEGAKWDPYSADCLTFAGELTQFALKGAEPPATPPQVANLVAAIKGLDKAGYELFNQGRASVDIKLKDLDGRISVAKGADQKNLQSQRKRITSYTAFDFISARAYVQSSLERE